MQALRAAYSDFGNKPLTLLGPPYSNPNYAGTFGQVTVTSLTLTFHPESVPKTPASGHAFDPTLGYALFEPVDTVRAYVDAPGLHDHVLRWPSLSFGTGLARPQGEDFGRLLCPLL
jgi:hypothetical protein